MPGVDGLNVIRTLKSEYADARFIALSGAEGGTQLLAKAKELGAQFAFEKPVDNQTLLDVIASLLDIRT